uniref:Uncharacterized protein n=1 Tax=Hyaloperonospora arabidopsidis (strain Emoy2) TaxID=559515 RepID=M4B9K7_HYAAE
MLLRHEKDKKVRAYASKMLPMRGKDAAMMWLKYIDLLKKKESSLVGPTMEMSK